MSWQNLRTLVIYLFFLFMMSDLLPDAAVHLNVFENTLLERCLAIITRDVRQRNKEGWNTVRVNVFRDKIILDSLFKSNRDESKCVPYLKEQLLKILRAKGYTVSCPSDVLCDQFPHASKDYNHCDHIVDCRIVFEISWAVSC